MRVMAVTFCVTLAASMAARQGSTTMAAFQVCLQVWLATSLLADGLAVAGQVCNFTILLCCLKFQDFINNTSWSNFMQAILASTFAKIYLLR